MKSHHGRPNISFQRLVLALPPDMYAASAAEPLRSRPILLRHRHLASDLRPRLPPLFGLRWCPRPAQPRHRTQAAHHENKKPRRRQDTNWRNAPGQTAEYEFATASDPSPKNNYSSQAVFRLPQLWLPDSILRMAVGNTAYAPRPRRSSRPRASRLSPQPASETANNPCRGLGIGLHDRPALHCAQNTNVAAVGIARLPQKSTWPPPLAHQSHLKAHASQRRVEQSCENERRKEKLKTRSLPRLSQKTQRPNSGGKMNPRSTSGERLSHSAAIPAQQIGKRPMWKTGHCGGDQGQPSHYTIDFQYLDIIPS